jgi:hypothetical protein
LAPGRCTTSTDLLTTRLGRRCRRSVWIKRLRISMWLVGRICRRWRRHGETVRVEEDGSWPVVEDKEKKDNRSLRSASEPRGLLDSQIDNDDEEFSD